MGISLERWQLGKGSRWSTEAPRPPFAQGHSIVHIMTHQRHHSYPTNAKILFHCSSDVGNTVIRKYKDDRGQGAAWSLLRDHSRNDGSRGLGTWHWALGNPSHRAAFKPYWISWLIMINHHHSITWCGLTEDADCVMTKVNIVWILSSKKQKKIPSQRSQGKLCHRRSPHLTDLGLISSSHCRTYRERPVVALGL